MLYADRGDDDPLEASIEKWKFIVNLVDDNGCSTCALCQAYHIDQKGFKQCNGCPVAQAGHAICENTPYQLYYNKRYRKNREELLEAARDEVKFLEGLFDNNSRACRVEARSDSCLRQG